MDQIYNPDATSQMIEIALRSSATGQLLTGKLHSDMTIKYQREGAATAATLSPVTATLGTWTSSGWKETQISGVYQFGIPNAALAAGSGAVMIVFTCTGAIDAKVRLVSSAAVAAAILATPAYLLATDEYGRVAADAKAMTGIAVGGSSYEQLLIDAGDGGEKIQYMVEGGGEVDYAYKASALVNAPTTDGLTAEQTGDAVLDEIVEGTYTLRQLMRLVVAVLAGKSDGGESTTNHFRNLADTKNRITATVDAAGNRTAVTVDVT